jgi:O-antigen ligase
MLGWGADRARRLTPVAALSTAAGAMIVFTVAVFALGPILSRFGPPQTEGRFMFWPVIASAIPGYLPFGTGIGAFDPVFRSIEPLQSLTPDFLNHAHNDFLEAFLEAGVLAVLALVAFVVWLAGRAPALWRQLRDRGERLPMACAISILIVLAHSSVDYPLRTEAMAVFFAWLCGVVARAGRSTEAPL